MVPDVLPFVSVVIPVYNDHGCLPACLSSLERQSYPDDRYEVIVVDNGSEPPLDNLVRPHPHARVCHESHPTVSAARNTGFRAARGEIIAFTDADCLPAEDWLERGVERLRALPNGGLVGGAVELFYQDPARPTATELHDKLTGFPQQQYVEKNHFGATANVFTYRDVLDRVGGFDRTIMSCDDLDLGRRIFSAGYAQSFAAEARVLHPARRSVRSTLKKAIRVEYGLFAVRRARGEPPRSLRRVAHTYVRSPLRGLTSALRGAQLSPADKLRAGFVGLARVVAQGGTALLLAAGVDLDVRNRWWG